MSVIENNDMKYGDYYCKASSLKGGFNVYIVRFRF